MNYLQIKGKRYFFMVVLVILTVMLLSTNLLAAKLHIATKDVEQIVKEVSTLTGLSFKLVPSIEVVNIQTLFKELGKETDALMDSFTREQLNEMCFSTYGTVAEYSWFSGKIYCLSEKVDRIVKSTGLDAVVIEKVAIFREMVRAIDDQNYRFKTYLAKAVSSDNLDLLKGITDAHGLQLLSQVYPKIGISEADFKKYQEDGYPDMDDDARVYQRLSDFIAFVTSHGKSIKDIYLNPPADSYYIFFPEKYVAGEQVQSSAMMKGFSHKTFTDKLPWQYEYASFEFADYMSLYDDILYYDFDESLLNGYRDGIYGFYSEKVAKKPEIYSSFSKHTITDLKKEMLVFSVHQYDSKENAKRWMDALIANDREDVQIAKSKLNFSIDQIIARYPNSYFSIVKTQEDRTQMYLVLTIDTVNVVDIRLTNTDITQEQLLGIINLINSCIAAKH